MDKTDRRELFIAVVAVIATWFFFWWNGFSIWPTITACAVAVLLTLELLIPAVYWMGELVKRISWNMSATARAVKLRELRTKVSDALREANDLTRLRDEAVAALDRLYTSYHHNRHWAQYEDAFHGEYVLDLHEKAITVFTAAQPELNGKEPDLAMIEKAVTQSSATIANMTAACRSLVAREQFHNTEVASIPENTKRVSELIREVSLQASCTELPADVRTRVDAALAAARFRLDSAQQQSALPYPDHIQVARNLGGTRVNLEDYINRFTRYPTKTELAVVGPSAD